MSRDYDDEGWSGTCPTCGSIYAEAKVAAAADEIRRILSAWVRPYPATEDDELEAAHEKLLRAYGAMKEAK